MRTPARRKFSIACALALTGAGTWGLVDYFVDAYLHSPHRGNRFLAFCFANLVIFGVLWLREDLKGENE